MSPHQLGFNFRLSEVAAAIGLAQLDRLPWATERRAAAAARYHQQLAGVDGIHLPFGTAPGVSAHHIMPALLAPGIDRRAFMQALKERGIQTSIHYPPTHLFTDFRSRLGTAEGLLPVTEDITAREVTLPLYPRLSKADVDIICGEIQAVLGELQHS